MEIDAKTEVNTTTLAAVLGLTGRRVQQLVQDGVIIAKARGRFPLCESVQNYIETQIQEKPASKADANKLKAEIAIKEAKAIVAKLEADELQGNMHRSEDVAAMTEDLIYTIRGMLLALPGRLATDTANASSPAAAAEIIRSEIHKVMNELSCYEYDRGKYEERVRERKKWNANRKPDDENEE